MVSNIVPNATGANVLGVDPRLSRAASPAPQRREDAGQGDRVDVSGAALALARESVRAGVAQVRETLALSHDAQALLLKVQALARAGGAEAQSGLGAALTDYADRIDGAVARGVRLAAGEGVTVQAEPGAEPVVISGVDLRLKDEPRAGDVIAVAAAARVSDPNLAALAQRSIENLQDAVGRLVDAARALDAHQGFLNAAESAPSVRVDLDAESARLLALQVRQGLEAAGAGPIANVEPQAVLALFRA